MNSLAYFLLILSALNSSALVLPDLGRYLNIFPVTTEKVLVLNHFTGKCDVVTESGNQRTFTVLGPTSYFFSDSSETIIAVTSNSIQTVHIDTGASRLLATNTGRFYGITNIGNLLLLGETSRSDKLALFNVR